jgi:hypothetical protein
MKMGRGASKPVKRKNNAPTLVALTLPILSGNVGYPTFESPSMLRMSRNTLPPIVPKAIGYKLKEIKLTVLEIVACPYMKAVPVRIPTKMLAMKPDLRFTV